MSKSVSRITIADLEVFYCIGISSEERAKPQRLLVTVDMTFDISTAAVSDRIEKTINYHTLAQELIKFGQGRTWRLVERLVSNIAERILTEYGPQAVTVEVKKFAIPQARYVSVTLSMSRT
jgi:FolB domain-containing protein